MKKYLYAGLVISSLTFSACTKTESGLGGCAIGTAVGSAIGYAIDGGSGGALMGGVMGAIGGGAIGAAVNNSEEDSTVPQKKVSNLDTIDTNSRNDSQDAEIEWRRKELINQRLKLEQQELEIKQKRLDLQKKELEKKARELDGK